MKVHCLFEQSGTFKNQFKARGIEAIDYDICNDFGQTDVQTDLFQAIRGGYKGEKSVFDNIEKSDLVIAFFPCTRFENNILMAFRGEQHGVNSWSDEDKIEYSRKLFTELHELYDLFSKMVLIAITRNLKLVIENPYSTDHALVKYFPIKAKLIDKDRSKHGDYFKKPTQYWFINCTPSNELRPCLIYPKTNITVNTCSVTDLGVKTKLARSMISPTYASYFIDSFLCDLLKEKEEIC